MATGAGPAVPGPGPGLGPAGPVVPGPQDRRPGGAALRAAPPGRAARRAARPAEQVADAVSAAYGRTLTVDGLKHLVTTRLEPLGLVVADEARRADAADARPAAARADPEGHAAPGPRRRACAGVLAPLFWPPLVAAVLAALVLADVVLFTRGGSGRR